MQPVAGNGSDARTSTGSAQSSAMGHPRGLVYDAAGNLYVADSRNHVIDRVAPGGTLTVIAGTGEEGFSGDGGAATAAQLSRPSAVAIGPDGTVFVADTGNHRIRGIDTSGVIRTVAGTGVAGNSGDGLAATVAQLRRPSGIAVDPNGNLLIADTGNHRVRSVSSGIIRPVAGTGEEGDGGDGGPALSATFQSPVALLPVSGGGLLVADTAARRVRLLKSGGTVAAVTVASHLRRPEGLAAGSAAGDVLITDADLQQLLQASENGSGAMAGSGLQGLSSSQSASTAALDSPSSVVSSANGDAVFSDRRNHRVERVALPAMDFGTVPAGQQSAAQMLSLENGSDDILQVTAISLPPGFGASTGATCGPLPFSLHAREICFFPIAFQPAAQGAATGLVTVTSTNLPTGLLRVNGTASPPTSLAQSHTSLASSGSISYLGAPVQLTATVDGTLLAAPVGTVSFADGTTALSTVALTASTSTYATAALTAGTHLLHATFSGDAHYASSSSPEVSVTVVAAPDFSLAASAASYAGKPSGTVSVPLTCSPQNGTLNHTVTLSVSGLPSGFTAVFSPSVFALGGSPVVSVMTVTVPATVSRNMYSRGPLLALLFLPLLLWRRRCAALLSLLALAGCGGGFRTAADTGGPTSTYHYNASVTATTTGVLGDTLTHGIPVELVITK